MLGYQPYYYQTIRKVIVAFGSIFNGIEIIKYDYNTRKDLGRVTVPLEYEGKETFLTRILGDPSLLRGTQINLPAMSYEFAGMKYNSPRKLSPYMYNTVTNANTAPYKLADGVAYDMNMKLYLYTRNFEDATQVIEQIVPCFQPSLTLSVKYLVAGNTYGVDNWIPEAMPVTLTSIDFQNDYDGPQGTVRQITWALDFNVQGLFFGPQTGAGLIKDVIINLRNPDANAVINSNTNVYSTIQANISPMTANAPGPNVNTIITITENNSP